MVLPPSLELGTSPLPRECSTTELRQQRLYRSPAGRQKVRVDQEIRKITVETNPLKRRGHCHKPLQSASSPVHFFVIVSLFVSRETKSAKLPEISELFARKRLGEPFSGACGFLIRSGWARLCCFLPRPVSAHKRRE